MLSVSFSHELSTKRQRLGLLAAGVGALLSLGLPR
jgi:hypothetical protein